MTFHTNHSTFGPIAVAIYQTMQSYGVDADELMAIRIVITSKFVSQGKLVQSLDEGFKKSTKGNLKPIQKETEQFRRCFSEKIVRGDECFVHCFSWAAVR